MCSKVDGDVPETCFRLLGNLWDRRSGLSVLSKTAVMEFERLTNRLCKELLNWFPAGEPLVMSSSIRPWLQVQ